MITSWNPCKSISAIAEACERLDPYRGLPDNLRSESTRPSSELANVFTAPCRGPASKTAGRREMVRRWLQFNGFQADADEFDRRLRDSLDRLRTWEQDAHESAVFNGPDFREQLAAGHLVFTRDWIGQELCDQLDDITDELAGTADYLRQLSAMIPDPKRATNEMQPTTPKASDIEYTKPKTLREWQAIWGMNAASPSRTRRRPGRRGWWRCRRSARRASARQSRCGPRRTARACRPRRKRFG